MKSDLWREQSVIRFSFRGVLQREAHEERIAQAFAECQAEMEKAYGERRLLTASLYRYGRFLFLYTEGLGEAAAPEKMFPAMGAVLQPWPPSMEEAGEDRLWACMRPYYFHAVPDNGGEWMQGRKPAQRRGRIALLSPGRWQSYLEHHLALMREGLIEGDKYHLISIHENVLFSYFEEPKTMTNLQKKPNSRSRALEEWLRTDPESHFARFAPGQGAGPDQNFVFLPCCAGI